MLINQKLPQGHIYPQITQAPVTTYADFLNYFRGGHTIDDNLGAHSIQATVQYTMFSTAIASGHLTKLKNMAIPDEFLADIFLTETGSELGQTVFDRKFCEMAVAEARKSTPENDGDLHPYVGAVVVKEGNVVATGFRGETGEGRHAEYCALRKVNDDVDNVDLSGCTVYTTLEPCSKRNSSNKTACATRLINAKVARVVYGMPDKDESVYGHVSLVEADIDVRLFPRDLIQGLVALNKKWSDTRRKPKALPPPNDTPPLANVSYNKPGTSMADNIHMFARPPKETNGFFTVEDAEKKVLAYGRTIEEAAVEWHRIDDQKVIVEKLNRQSYGSSNRLFSFI
jgi:pyrimidine deaminase RibD-like protein